jgi:hypothetical protein
MNLREKDAREILKDQVGNSNESSPITVDILNNTINDFLKIFYANEAYVKAAVASYFSYRGDFIDFNHNNNSYRVKHLANQNGEQKLIVVINNSEGFVIDTFREDKSKSIKHRYFKRSDKGNISTVFGDKALAKINRIKDRFTASNS